MAPHLTPYHRAVAERDDARARLTAVLAQLDDLRRLWSLPKYHAPQQDGTRGDWIASGDVLRELESLRGTVGGEPYPR